MKQLVKQISDWGYDTEDGFNIWIYYRIKQIRGGADDGPNKLQHRDEVLNLNIIIALNSYI